VARIAAGGMDLYCHSEPPLTSGKLCFIIDFIGGHREGAEFLLEGRPPGSLFEPPLTVVSAKLVLVVVRSFQSHPVY